MELGPGGTVVNTSVSTAIGLLHGNGREPGVPTECTDDPNSWPCPLTRPSDPDLVRMTVDQPASGAGVGGHMLSLTIYLSTRETDMTS